MNYIKQNFWLFLPVFIVLFVPFSVSFQIYNENLSEFAAPLPNVVQLLILPYAAVLILLCILLLIIPYRVKIYAASLLYAVGLLFLLQGVIINWDYGVLTGSPIEWDQYKIRLIIDSLIWMSVPVLFLFNAKRLKKHFTFIFLVIISIQTIFIAFSFLGSHKQPSSQNYTLSDENRMQFSQEKNVVIVVLDAFQSDVFQEILDEYPEYYDLLKGFTFFRNSTSQYSKTYGAIPALLTGEWYHNQKPLQQFLQEAFKKSISTRLKADGWMAHLYPMTPRIIGYSEDYATNIQPGVDDNNIARDAGRFIDFAFFRTSPQFLKPFWINDMQWRFQNIIPATIVLRDDDDNAFEAEIEGNFFHPIQRFIVESKEILSVDSKLPTFKFFHFNIPHEPFALNEDLQYEKLPSNRIGFKRYSVAGIEAVKRFLSQLKQRGIYSKTMIFIVGDHGGGEYGPGVRAIDEIKVQEGDIPSMHHESGLPLILAKPFEGSGKLNISEMPVSLGDVASTISMEVENEYDYNGINMFNPNQSKMQKRDRRYLFYKFEGWNHDYLPEMKEYKITGHSWSPSSWRPTGEIYSPPLNTDEKKHENIDSTLAIGNKYKPQELKKAGFFDNGWSLVEEGFIWSKADKATIKIKTETLKAVKISLSIRPYTCGGIQTQKVKAVAKGVEIASWDVDQHADYSVVIPKSFFDSDGTLTISLDIPDAISPVDCKAGLDSRKLGVALTGFVMSEVEQPINRKFFFNEKAISDTYTTFGWGHQETNHRWTTGPQAGLLFLLDTPPASDLLLTMKVFPYLARGEIDRQIVDVTVNRKKVAQWSIQEENWYEAEIPAGLVGEDGRLKVVFDISNPASPAEFGHSSDKRKLGMSVRELVIKEAGI